MNAGASDYTRMDNSQHSLDTDGFLALLQRHLRYPVGNTRLQMDSDLYALGLDSMAAVNLLLEIEERYSVLFPDHLLTDDTFRTPTALRSVIESLVVS